MFNFLSEPSFMPCGDCGESLAREERDTHRCERERRLDYCLFQLRDEIAAFDAELEAYLGSPAGRFAAWYAAHRR